MLEKCYYYKGSEITMAQFKNSDFKVSTMCSPDSQTGCVGVAIKGEAVGIKDMKDESLPALNFNAEEWKAFIAGVKRGEFDI
jgi:hypothetical protein